MSVTIPKKIYLFVFNIIILLSLMQETYGIQCDTCILCDQYADIYDLIELNQSINTTGNCIVIGKSNVIIDCNGFNISGGGNSKGIDITSKNNITIKNCTIKNFQSGIYKSTATDSTLINNSLVSNTNYGILAISSSYNNITTNTFTKNTHGIYLINSNLNKLRSNRITDNAYGITTATSDSNTIYNNKIKNNTNYEINITGNGNNITRNYFKKTVTLDINYPSNTIFENNIFADWTAGPPNEFLADFETLTQALSSAAQNDRIYAFKKTYNECLNITKTLTINGEEKTATKINCTGNAPINISANNLKFSNFTLISNTPPNPALYLAGNYAHISNITIQSQQKGIQIPGTNHHILKYIKLTNTAYALNITLSDNTTITLSEFTNSSILTKDSTNIQITNSTFTDTQNATTLQNTNNSLLANNTYAYVSTTSTQLIQLITCTNTNITENIIQYTFPAFPTDISILLRHSAQSSVRGNRIDNANTAIELQNTNSTHIINNTITDAGTSITLTCHDCTINENTIEKNTITNSNKAISAQNTHNTKITQNKITSITGAQSITLINTTQDNITENTFNTGITAITLKNANNTLIESNNFSNYAQTSIEFDTLSYNTENTIKDNTIIGGTFPLKILHNYKSRITNNTIAGATNTAIHINNTNTTNITQNTIKYSPAGIYVEKSEDNLIDNNTIKHIIEKGIYFSGSIQHPNPNNTISNNYLLNITGTPGYAIHIQYIRNALITDNTIDSSIYAAILSFTFNTTIKNNTIADSGNAGLYIQNSQYNNITENIFKNNAGNGIELVSGSSNNSLWVNNFSDASNEFKENNNDYCIIGVDNNYHESINDSYPLSCNRIFTNSFNDTAIYINETIDFKTNTFGGESKYTSLNITINNTNHTMTLTEGDNITGNWTYVFKDTLTAGRYDATCLYYLEADNDEDTEIVNISFWVMELSMLVNITPNEANINETILIEATVQNNATPIEYVKSEIYWNNTLVDTQTEDEFDEISENERKYTLETNKTERSGTYTVNTTVVAGQNITSKNTFHIRYGTANITINHTPQLAAYNTTTTQNYTITAIGGDLNNITITFNSTNTSIINITTPTQHISYLNASQTWSSYINITAINTGTAQINITAAPANGTQDTETKNITVKKINMIAYTAPQTANVTQVIDITAEVWDNTTQIKNITAKIYRNNTQLVDTLLLTYQYKLETLQNTTYFYKNTTYQTQKSGNYTINITAYATNNARHNTHYYINYGTANITINHTPQLAAYNTTTTQNYTITAIGGDLNNITITFKSSNTSIINITTPTQTISYLNASQTWSSYINITAINTGTAQINITAAPTNGTQDTETKDITVKKINMIAYTTPQTANVTQEIDITAEVWDNTTQIKNITAKIYRNNTQLVDTILLTYQYKLETPENTTYFYKNTTYQTQRSGNYTVNITAYATNNARYTTHYYINYGTANITINHTPQLAAYNTTTTQYYTITAIKGDLNNITITFNSTNTSIINITTPSLNIPYLNSSSQTQDLYINLTALNTGTARVTINTTIANGTADVETKNITVKKINLTAYTPIHPKNISENLTITAVVQNNVSEITNVTAEIHWNGSSIATVVLAPESITGYGEGKYTYWTTTNYTQRSGNYTVIVTAYATNNATDTVYYYVNYGYANITIYTAPSQMNTNTIKTQSVNITAVGGDLENITAAITIDDPSKLNLALGKNATKNQSSLYINNTWTIDWQLNATDTPNATINISVNAYNTTDTSKQKTIHIKELTLETALSATTINITQTIQLHANITGNITQIEYITANITWNQTSKQNITLHYHHYYPAEEKHAYTGTITDTECSGDYEAFVEAKAEITINTTETFFVNYGQPEITFGPDPQKLNVSENRTQEITIKPKDGDLANITVKLTSDNETILNLSDTQNPIQTIDYIFYSTYNEREGETVQYNLTGKSVGIANITVNVTSENNSPETGKKEIEVTGDIENNAPNVTAIWTNSSIDTYNLQDSITIYANISDDSGLETKIAEITKPDGYKENKTMIWSGTGNTYKTQNPFTNTTNTSNYTIKIHAIDYYSNANDTETKNFTLTNIYLTTTIDTYQLYNRGENATITIYVYDVNNNMVHNFNTSLNITYESNTTILLENNQTDIYTYYINTSILGIHNLSANITKNGNIASNTSTFNATNILDMSYYTSLTIYPPTSWIRELRLHTNYKRGDPYTNNLNTSLYCYNDSSNHWGIVPLAKSSSNTYTYTSEGDPQCYAPSPSCQQFKITANITDAYNNSGTKLLSLSTSGCTTSQDPPGGGGGSSSGGGIAGLIQNATERVKEYIYGNQTNTTTIISDFKFTISKKETRINQGEDTTIIATLDNIGDIHQKITATITKQCCNITLKDKTYSIWSKNKQDIPIRIHASLTTDPGEYLTTVTMVSENITKAETFTITIQENSLITDLKNLENRITEHEKEIESYTESGLNTAHLKKALNELKSHIENAKQYIKKDDLKNLKTSISEANKKSNYITLELLRLKTQKWLYENKEIIAVTIIAIIILSYLAIYFIIPYYYLTKELKDLKSKELKFKDEERTVQKQYFMRQLDEATFNKLMQEKHSVLLDTRSQIKQIEEKITLLTRGKLNLKKEEHSKYFILNKITKNKQASTEKKIDIKEKIKLLKEQEYNLVQSTKEAEKNYYSRIITQEELEQITNNNRAKTETIKTQLHTIEKLQSAAPQKDLKPKVDIITKLKQKYTQYKLKKQKARIENKIHTLQKHESEIEEKDRELKTKEEQIKKEIEILKKQENQPTDSE